MRTKSPYFPDPSPSLSLSGARAARGGASVVLGLLLTCAASCAHSPADRPATADRAKFTRAELRVVMRGTMYRNPAVVTGPELDGLLVYFPGVGTGRNTDFHPFCGVGYELDLYQPQGRVHTITMDGGLKYWSEGNGYWFLHAGFRDVAARLLRNANPTAATSPAASF